MKVLVACEFSGVVRDAFIARGHNAISCDILDTVTPGPHIKGDIRSVNLLSYDLMIAHPPCTYLCSSGAGHWKNKRTEQEEAKKFFMWLVNNGFHVIENPIGIMSHTYRTPDQYIHPWQHGHADSKKTCLWLNGVTPLVPTKIVTPLPGIHTMSKSPIRSMLRSITYAGIVKAMADQWG